MKGMYLKSIRELENMWNVLNSMWQDKLQRIIEMLEASDVNEIEINFWGRKFRVSKGADAFADSASVTQPSTVTVENTVPETEPTQEVSPEAGKEESGGVEITAPMVGTFYAASSPESPPFVNVGDHVSAGQILCIIEAMKIMNEIESDITGRIDRVLVQNAKPVEYGQPIFIITPD